MNPATKHRAALSTIFFYLQGVRLVAGSIGESIVCADMAHTMLGEDRFFSPAPHTGIRVGSQVRLEVDGWGNHR